MALTASIAALTGLSACSDSDDPGAGREPAGPELSRGDFVERATKICIEAGRTGREATAAELRDPAAQDLPGRQRQLRAVQAGIAAVLPPLEELGRLNAPDELQPHVDQLLADLEELSGLYDRLAALDGQQGATEEGSEVVTRITELAASSRRAAQQAGLSSCLPERTP